MDEKERLLYLATKQFNLTEQEATALLIEDDKIKDDAADILLEADKARIQRLKDERLHRYDEGYQTAEKKFKAHGEETFRKLTGYQGTEEDFEGMFQKWYSEEKKKLAKKTDITDDDIKRNPLYIQLESTSVPLDKYSALEKEYNDFKTNQQREQVMSKVTDNAWNLALAKIIQSDNPAVAETRRQDFLRKFYQFDYEFQDNKTIVLRDGRRLEDERGNLLPFESFVMDMASINYDLKAQDDKGNAGNRQGAMGTVIITDKPTTEDEYNKALDKWDGAGEDHAKMRIAIKKYYEEHKKD